MWATCPRSASSGYHAEFLEGYYQKHINPSNCRTSSSDISGYHAEFHEVHCAVGEWQGCVMVWLKNGMGAARARHEHGMVRHGHGMARHGMCELALTVVKKNKTYNDAQTLDLLLLV
jgi:hypothetical protein